MAAGCDHLLILISAPSGGGKTTLCQQLLAARPDIVRAVTCTTRAPRTGEKDGVDYHFLAAAEFEQHAQAGDFIEHAAVYGQQLWHIAIRTARQAAAGPGRAVERGRAGRGDDPRTGAGGAGIETRAGDGFFDAAIDRGAGRAVEETRCTDPPAAIQKRLGVARQEIAQWKNFDYLLISTSVPEDLRRMLAIVEAEKMRAARAPAPEF